MASRLDDYAALLEDALAAGYRIEGVSATWERLQHGGLETGLRHLVLRHDVDTDPATARAMWAIDRRLGVRSSYFFRLSTLDLGLMAEIAEDGGEASYHYEELATLAKRRRLRTADAARAALPAARELFAANLGRLRRTTGLPMRVVAAHGDFVNRYLGVPNWALLEDAALRTELGIELDPYDEAFLRHLPERYIDAMAPDFWEPSDLRTAIDAGTPVVSVLVHPRHWHARRGVNARDAWQRVSEGIRYRLPAGASR
jgi:hypothetical protein